MAESGWYRAGDARKSVRQVVIEAARPRPVASRFGVLRLEPPYRTLMTMLWAVGLFRLPDDPGPYLLVRADGQTTRLKGRPFRVALAFYRMDAGGLVALFVDYPGVSIATAPSAPFVLFETIRGLDLDDERQRMTDTIAGPRLHLCFAEGEGPGDDLASGLVSGGHLDALYDVLVDLAPSCRAALEDEWASLLHYHDTLPADRRDFQAAVWQLQRENPVEENPVLGQEAGGET